jgi:hypothetical protein
MASIVSLLLAVASVVFFAVFTACMLDVNLGGIGQTMFSWHPIFMAAAITLMGIGRYTGA